MAIDLQGALGGSIAETLEGEVSGFIKQLGGKPNLLSLNVTENGTYTPPEGYDGYNEVTVDIEPTLETLSVTENGTYTPTSGVDGYNEINVNVPTPTLTSLTVTENGTYTPPLNTAYNEIIVNCPSPPIIILNADNIQIGSSAGYYMPQQPLTNNITSEGYYIVSLKYGSDVWNSVIYYDGVSDTEFNINYSNAFRLHLTPTTIGTQSYGGDYRNIYVKLSKLYIDNNQIF